MGLGYSVPTCTLERQHPPHVTSPRGACQGNPAQPRVEANPEQPGVGVNPVQPEVEANPAQPGMEVNPTQPKETANLVHLIMRINNPTWPEFQGRSWARAKAGQHPSSVQVGLAGRRDASSKR
jgi:hypothetical protein